MSCHEELYEQKILFGEAVKEIRIRIITLELIRRIIISKK